jgi:predicted KAP-like P-loop ATPase
MGAVQELLKERRIMSSYLTDNATRDPKADALNFGDFRPVLKEILTTAETPLTVGIFGTWGSGKTSLMGMLRDEIEGEKKYRARTVWFTAWKYDRQEALWRALILRVLEAMYPREDGDGPREERDILTNPGQEQ